MWRSRLEMIRTSQPPQGEDGEGGERRRAGGKSGNITDEHVKEELHATNVTLRPPRLNGKHKRKEDSAVIRNQASCFSFW